jgi:hypothetical protein
VWLAAALCALTCFALAGCVESTPSLTSSWPLASAETTVPMPPEAMRWPLTGLPAPSIQEIGRLPLSVKVDNSTTSSKVGLSAADVVYEWASSEGKMQLNALFQSSVPAVVGPVAPAAVLDLSIVIPYRALFFSAAATEAVTAVEKQQKMTDLSREGGVASPYVSGPKPSMQGAFLDTAEAYASAERLGIPIAGDPARLRFATAVEATQPIVGVSIPVSEAHTVDWTWQPASKSYAREVDGKKHIDAVTRSQLTATNVVVMWVKNASLAGADPSQVLADSALVGSGQVTIFRDGVRVDGKWKAEQNSPPRFFAENGKPVGFAPGNTWFEVVPSSANITLR